MAPVDGLWDPKKTDQRQRKEAIVGFHLSSTTCWLYNFGQESQFPHLFFFSFLVVLCF
jgi:hypothetical protein